MTMGYTKALTVDTDPTFAGNSTTAVPSQSAVKTAIDLKSTALLNYTYATLPSAASNSGLHVWVTDVGVNSGSEWISDGVDWYPRDGEVILIKDNILRILANTGTINTGSSGHITLGTPQMAVYSACWLYLPAIASTPAITAGWYYCSFSSATVGTIYTSGPGSAAFNFSAGAAFTGVSTETTIQSLAIPAGLLGTNGRLYTEYSLSMSASTNSRTSKILFDATTMFSETFTSASHVTIEDYRVNISNMSSGAQRISPNGRPDSVSGVPTTATFDTTAAFTYYFNGTKTASGTRFEVSNFILRLIK